MIHDLIPGEIDGLPVLIAAPVVAEADPPRVREGIARRRALALTGACPCGAVAVMPSRAQRRAALRAARRAGHTGVSVVVDVDHAPGCPAVHPYGEGGSR